MPRSRVKKYAFLALSVAAAALVLGTALIVSAGLSDHPGQADVALVLGSKVQLDGTPSLGLQARLDKTLELYRAGYFPRVIASGGVGKEGYDEALVMKDYLVAGGIPAESVIVDNHGNNTFLSARHTLLIARQQKIRSVFVVTQYFHVPRARLALERFGITTVYSAHAQLFEARDAYSSPREVFGYLTYFFRHYDTDPAPSA